MELQTLNVSKRDGHGKGKARQTRRAGEVPGIVYGGGQEPLSIRFDARTFGRMTHGRGGEHAVLQLEVEGDAGLSGPALLKEVQHHPVRGHAIHVDFQRISLDERITTEVPLVLEGRAPGVADGGVLDQMMREIEIECRALDMPEKITVDVSAMNMGDSLHVSDVVAPANVTIVSDPERMIAAIHAPRAVVEAEAAEGEAQAEPEVIGKKQEDEGAE